MSGNEPRTVVDFPSVFLMRPRGKELHRQTHVAGGKISCQWHLAASNKRFWLHFDHRPAIKRGVESKDMKNLKRGIRLILSPGCLALVPPADTILVPPTLPAPVPCDSGVRLPSTWDFANAKHACTCTDSRPCCTCTIERPAEWLGDWSSSRGRTHSLTPSQHRAKFKPV